MRTIGGWLTLLPEAASCCAFVGRMSCGAGAAPLTACSPYLCGRGNIMREVQVWRGTATHHLALLELLVVSAREARVLAGLCSEGG